MERVRELLEQIRDFGHLDGCCSYAELAEALQILEQL